MDKNSLKKAVLPASVVTAVFFLNYFCFGRENAIIGPFLTLSFLKFKDMEDYRGCMLRTLGVYCIMAAAAWAALLHPILTVVWNGLALFWIGYFLIDEYNPLNYFPAGMALIFFQNSPVSLGRLPLRLLALAVSFFLIFIFLGCKSWPKEKVPGLWNGWLWRAFPCAGGFWRSLRREKPRRPGIPKGVSASVPEA